MAKSHTASREYILRLFNRISFDPGPPRVEFPTDGGFRVVNVNLTEGQLAREAERVLLQAARAPKTGSRCRTDNRRVAVNGRTVIIDDLPGLVLVERNGLSGVAVLNPNGVNFV